MNYKRTNMGDLPGDIPKQAKAAMLEKNIPFQVWPWQILNEKCARAFRKEIHKKAKKRFRRTAKKEIEGQL